jgi:coenzyme F420-dependent glucose-6-phosphate dehydrogenase
MEIGYWLASEEHSPRELVENARRAEEAGFEFLLISDHYHPWVNAQGHSPFVWGVIGAIARATSRIRLGTAVTCPLIRIHPAIVAHAAATAQELMGGRFFLGLGTGENLNEHVVGERWPRPDERLDRLEEAITVIRALFGGDFETFRGTYYTVEQARLYDAPSEPAPIIVAAAATRAVQVAARMGDGLMSTTPDEDLVRTYEQAGGSKPIYGKVTGVYAPSEATAKLVGLERQPNAAMSGSISQDLALPRDFETVAQLVRPDDLEGALALGGDPSAWAEHVDEYERSGFTHVCLHDASTDQEAFIEFAKERFLR